MITETIRMAFQALRGNALRSALTLVGMAIGVFSVVASVTAVAVLESTLTDSLAALGSQTITFSRFTKNGPSAEDEDSRPILTLAQAEALAERSGLPVSPSVARWGVEVRTDDAQTDPDVMLDGTDEAYAANHGMDLAEGRYLDAEDIRGARAVAVLGSTVRDKLFTGRDAVGREVRIDGRRYTVVGVLAPESGGFGMMDPNKRVVAPVSRVVDAYGMADEDVEIDVRAPTAALLSSTRDQATGALRAVRQLAPEADNDFGVTSGADVAENLKGFTRALSLGGAGVGLIALLAAGVGVMNIMLVSVTERTREIGIRKALGATRGDIRRQFLVEAVVLCQMGGLVGVALGVLGGNVAAALMSTAPAFPWGWALGALAGVAVVALTFGVVPAVQAARLRPIDALRSE
ncbi:MAG TPA: ABC transporter permease [Rubricoccaceae bacterium]|jgi:putative ABC transport system permease protein